MESSTAYDDRAEQSETVLKQLDYSDEEIAKFKSEAVIL
jgi:hypothetical protein